MSTTVSSNRRPTRSAAIAALVTVSAVLGVTAGGALALARGAASSPSAATVVASEPVEPVEPDAEAAVVSVSSMIAAFEDGDCEAFLAHFTVEFRARELGGGCEGIGSTDVRFGEPSLAGRDPVTLRSDMRTAGHSSAVEFELELVDGEWLIDGALDERETDPDPPCGGLAPPTDPDACGD